MKLTKKEAVRLHRQLWNRIADKTLKEKRCVVKEDVIEEITDETVLENCFCCEYDGKIRDDCECCPILWPQKEYCTYVGSPYSEWQRTADYKRAAELARQIAELPERPDSSDDILDYMSKYPKLTKSRIEEMANEIIAFLEEEELINDVCIYFNDKRIRFSGEWNSDYTKFEIAKKEEENICPLDYFKYARIEHILSMSFEGGLYDRINYSSSGRTEEALQQIFEKYGCYFELGNAWNLSAYPNDDEMEIEYTDYSSKQEPDPKRIYYNNTEDIPDELREIMNIWWQLSEKTGDIGSCVMGAGFKFKYKNILYFMSACSPWQGSCSWEAHVDHIRGQLEKIGATEIYYDYGVLD